MSNHHHQQHFAATINFGDETNGEKPILPQLWSMLMMCIQLNVTRTKRLKLTFIVSFHSSRGVGGAIFNNSRSLESKLNFKLPPLQQKITRYDNLELELDYSSSIMVIYSSWLCEGFFHFNDTVCIASLYEYMFMSILSFSWLCC